MKETVTDIELAVTAKVQADLEKKLILLDDVRQTIRHAESSGEKLIDNLTGRFIARFLPMSVPYWVEYTLKDGRYTVHRAYSNRM